MSSKLELRLANRQAWQTGKDVIQAKNLDSNIKKNTTFIKKCKTSLAADYRPQLLNDIKKLSLEKYISEIVVSVMEGMLKCKTSVDIAAAVEVISALHQRFPNTFTLLLTSSLAKALQPFSKQYLASLSQEQREKEDASRIARQRTYLRIATELWLMGVLRNVEDGISSLGTSGLDDVDTQRDGVAGLMSSSSTSLDKKKLKKDEKESNNPTGFVYRVLRELFASDLEQHVNLPLAASFLKNFGPEILGIIPRKQRAAAEQQHQQQQEQEDGAVVSGMESDDIATVTPEQRQAIKELLISYYRTVVKHLKKEHSYIKKMDRRNNETLFARGDLSEETKQRHEKATKLYEKLLANTETLADGLDEEMPDLPEDEGVTKVSIVSTTSGSSFADGKETGLGNSVWEDDDARKFYEDLPDLRVLVPGVFLDSQTSTKKESEEGVTSETEGNDTTIGQDGLVESETTTTPSAIGEDDNDLDDDTELEATDLVDETLDEKDDGTETVKPTQLAQLDALLGRLTTLGNRDMIDSAAIEFCYLNSKGARKRLIKALLNIPRQRVDLLPYYARLIAILNQYYTDIGDAILVALNHEFRGLQKKKTQDLVESRIKNIRFLSELTKFKVAPYHTIFHAFKVALDDFTNQNIDIVCNLLETCGRYLLRTPETSARMSTMLEIVMRKKNVQHLDNRQALMVENAYYQANPPDRTAIVEKERSPIELFVRRLIYSDLNKKSLDKTLKLLRKLDWEDPAIQHLLNKVFQKVWKIKYSNIHLMAILASGLNRHHSFFGMQVVDAVVEEIRVGLEHNIFKHNQRRIATVKYLGELYNYRMIDSPLVFDTLYSIVTLGHEFGRPSRERFCPMDAPNDFFRIRLCCTLLDTCGMCFDRGSSKKKLDHFLTFFQMYILSKAKPPMDVDFMISDTFEMLRPKMHIFSSYEEANAEVDLMLLDQLKTVQGNEDKIQEDGFEESEGSDSSSDEDNDDELVDVLDKEDEDNESVDEEIEVNRDDEEDEVVVLKRQEQQQKEEDDEFEKEFSKMVSDSIESRKFEKKATMLDVPIPMNLRGTQDRRSLAEKREQPNGSMAFTLLTKKGNRQQTKIMQVPADSALAVTTRSKQEAEREEHQQLKRLVLSYEEREITAARQEALDEKQRQRQLKGKRILHMGGGAGQQYTSSRGSNSTGGANQDWRQAFE
ncbi:armadillo-type protein [Halteromyces radiatus]|uniref:armadillo-type protein n=1 Tax=Halteromyces radiatus TaxID=101107 RepID=UPI0022208C8D|nr:armadillo-type protein [Halteromyces radiatus]KAI8096391.1 armadillo-type protein [Halteromyces radiatus]